MSQSFNRSGPNADRPLSFGLRDEIRESRFPASRWPAAPDFVAYFDRKLVEFADDKNVT